MKPVIFIENTPANNYEEKALNNYSTHTRHIQAKNKNNSPKGDQKEEKLKQEKVNKVL